MADQLTGRALDEAAAIAMGWTFRTFPNGPCPEVKHWMRPNQPEAYHWRSTPALSTDHDYIPAMFEWLHDNGKTCVIMASYEDHVTCCGTQHVSNDNIHTKGRTLPEALARLVVEVARARGKQ